MTTREYPGTFDETIDAPPLNGGEAIIDLPDAFASGLGKGKLAEMPPNKVQHGGNRLDRETGRQAVEAAEPLKPLKLISAAEWEGQPVPERRWLVPNRIPLSTVTLLYGDGAAGKTTIAQQLCVGTVRGTDWLGGVITAPGPALFMSAEEDIDELHRRLDAIRAHFGISYADMRDFHMLSMPGEDAVLGVPDRSGVVRATPLFQQLETMACELRPSLFVIESAADVFAGNENDRSQVRQFMSLLRRPAIKSGAAVMLLAHPSVSGMQDGSGRSGTTGWSNSSRSRLYFTGVKANDDGEPDTEPIRELKVMKANYGPMGECIRVRWQRGVFVPVNSSSPIDRAAVEASEDEAFLRCLAARDKLGEAMRVSPHKSSTWAPTVFATMPEAAGHKTPALEGAMNRLLRSDQIKAILTGPKSRQRTHLQLAELMLPGG